MRNRATRIESPEVEAAIEETRRFLEPRVRDPSWKGDPLPARWKMNFALIEIERSSLPDFVKSIARSAILKAMHQGKRDSKPTRWYRYEAICAAAERLTPRYHLTRNEATKDKQSACGIVWQALRRLDVKMTEKRINEIVLNDPKRSPTC